MAVDSPTNILVKCLSVTGALVATFYNNTLRGENLLVECSERKDGGLNDFSFTVPSDTPEPLFNDMECQIHVDGVHWFSGFAEYIPERDTDDPIIRIEGKGFVNKLKEKFVDETYTTQTLDYIIKDLANTYLGADINVYYDILKISVPVVSALTIEFNSKSLFECFTMLAGIANKDYDTAPYTWGVDEEKELYFNAISTTDKAHFFEGYHYQSPGVEKISSNIVNKILVYRTTTGGTSTSEYVATYEDTGSQGLYGLYGKKITFPDYIDTTTISNICNGVLEKYAEPFNQIEIRDLPVTEKLDIGFYATSNRKDMYFLNVNELEDITDWNITQMLNSTPTISEDQVFTGRKALKIVSTASSANDYMEHTLAVPVKFPETFRIFVYLADPTCDITITLTDTNNNSVDLQFTGAGYEDQWIKRLTLVSLELDTGFIQVDYDVSNSGFLIVDYDGSNSGKMLVDTLVREGVTDIAKVRITMNAGTVNTVYVDAMDVEANTYLYRSLLVEELKYTLNKSRTVDMVLGGKVDSLIDGIQSSVSSGNIALAVFSKQ